MRDSQFVNPLARDGLVDPLDLPIGDGAPVVPSSHCRNRVGSTLVVIANLLSQCRDFSVSRTDEK